MQRQIGTTHVENKYPCDLCEYKANETGELKIHKESVHVINSNKTNDRNTEVRESTVKIAIKSLSR